jgi:GSH-dependent disulfide-bond oxidoreductase
MSIELHTWNTPNGRKISVALEEMGLPYEVKTVNIGKGEQFAPAFVKISPNSKIPAIIDPEGPGGAPISIFESGAIMMYLGEKERRFFPQDLRGKYEVTQWVMWQMANQGPKLGECGHFRRAGPDAGDLTYAIRRFTDEANRLYGVMNNRLYDRKYLAGDEYTIADMISYPWTVGWEGQGQDIGEFKHFKRWFDEIGNRPAVKRGMETGNNLRVDPSTLTAAEREQMRKIMYNQRAISAPA